MSTKSKTKSKSAKTTKSASSIVWFEIPVDDPARAKKFYSGLFGWKIKAFPGMDDYWHIDTGGGDDSPDGALMGRKNPEHTITNYIAVTSLDKSVARLEKLGGKICMPRTAVPTMGYFAICQDPDQNTFALWERDPGAK
jgi:predicted enzyme related to lactoylglutathione lyase